MKAFRNILVEPITTKEVNGVDVEVSNYGKVISSEIPDILVGDFVYYKSIFMKVGEYLAIQESEIGAKDVQ